MQTSCMEVPLLRRYDQPNKEILNFECMSRKLTCRKSRPRISTQTQWEMKTKLGTVLRQWVSGYLTFWEYSKLIFSINELFFNM